MQGYLAVSDLPLVSMDFKKSDVSTTIDSSLTMVMGDDMVKVGHLHTCTYTRITYMHIHTYLPGNHQCCISSSTRPLPDCLLLLSPCCNCFLFVLSYIACVCAMALTSSVDTVACCLLSLPVDCRLLHGMTTSGDTASVL